MRRNLIFLVIIVVFSLVGIKALFTPALYSAHDIWHQVARLFWYQKAVSEGQFPPYWIGNLAQGLGYPLFLFSYHLPWLAALPLLRLGLDIGTTIKTLLIVAYLLSGIFMYLFAESLLKNKVAALLASLLYLWAPYRFLVNLVSASMGVAFIFVFLPVLLWGIYEGRVILIAIGLSGVILSHFASLPSLTPLILIFVLFFWPKINRRNLFLGIALGFSLSSFYLVPALYYRPLTRGFGELYKSNFVNLSQLIYSKWGYGIIGTSAKEGVISFQIGMAQWISVLGVFALLIKRKAREKRAATAFLAIFLVSIFFMLDVSRPIWDLINRFISIDYPTRFMAPAVLSASIFSGFVYVSLKKRWRLLFWGGLILLALYTNRNHLRVNMYTNYPVSLYVDSEVTTTSSHEYLPTWADISLLSEKRRSIVEPSLPVTNLSQNTRELSFSIDIPKETKISINHFSYPGINLYVDEKKVSYETDRRGRISLRLPKGRYEISVKFEETEVIKLGKILTTLGIFGLFGFVLHSKRGV